eukprot:1498334-Ditylum_brightwellii.AAC.1
MEGVRIFGAQKREEKGVVIHLKEACSKSLDGKEGMGVENKVHLLTAKDPMNKMEKIKEAIVADGKSFDEKRAESGVGANDTLHRDYYWSGSDVVDTVG